MQQLTVSGKPRCQALTKSGTQCTRNAEVNSMYCWQHQDYKVLETKEPEIKVNPSLLQKSIQPGILANILTTAGYSTGINQETHLMVQNQLPNIVRSWLKSINVKAPLETISNVQMEFLILLYQSRVGNRPRSELIFEFAEKGFDRSDIFYSYEHTLPVENLSSSDQNRIKSFFTYQNNNLRTRKNQENLKELQRMAKSLLEFKTITQGDTIRFGTGDRNDYVLVWNGSELVELINYLDDYGSLSPDILIQDYPLVDYFKYTIDHNEIVWLKADPNQVKLIANFQNVFYKYQIGSDPNNSYIVYTRVKELFKNGNIQFFDYITVDNRRHLLGFIDEVMHEELSPHALRELIRSVKTDLKETFKQTRLILKESDY